MRIIGCFFCTLRSFHFVKHEHRLVFDLGVSPLRLLSCRFRPLQDRTRRRSVRPASPRRTRPPTDFRRGGTSDPPAILDQMDGTSDEAEFSLTPASRRPVPSTMICVSPRAAGSSRSDSSRRDLSLVRRLTRRVVRRHLENASFCCQDHRLEAGRTKQSLLVSHANLDERHRQIDRRKSRDSP